jgi:hypothetical protein
VRRVRAAFTFRTQISRTPIHSPLAKNRGQLNNTLKDFHNKTLDAVFKSTIVTHIGQKADAPSGPRLRFLK